MLKKVRFSLFRQNGLWKTGLEVWWYTHSMLMITKVTVVRVSFHWPLLSTRLYKLDTTDQWDDILDRLYQWKDTSGNNWPMAEHSGKYLPMKAHSGNSCLPNEKLTRQVWLRKSFNSLYWLNDRLSGKDIYICIPHWSWAAMLWQLFHRTLFMYRYWWTCMKGFSTDHSR